MSLTYLFTYLITRYMWLNYVLDDLVCVKNDYNVITVAWDLGSNNLDYAQSASNTR